MRTYKNYVITAIAIIIPLFSCIATNDNVNHPQASLQVEQEKLRPTYSWLMVQIRVHPQHIPAYEQKILNNFTKQAKESQGVVKIHYHAPTSTYFLVFPMNDMTNWEEYFNYWQQIANKTEMKKSSQDYFFMLTKSLPQFSRAPSGGHLNKMNPDFAHIDIIEVFPYAETHFEELLAEWTAQIKSQAPKCAMFVHRVMVGKSQPAYYFFRGDCIDAQENKGALTIDKFLNNKQAFGSIVKNINSYDLKHMSHLSTGTFPVTSLD